MMVRLRKSRACQNQKIHVTEELSSRIQQHLLSISKTAHDRTLAKDEEDSPTACTPRSLLGADLNADLPRS